jgi:hypothetical protein
MQSNASMSTVPGKGAGDLNEEQQRAAKRLRPATRAMLDGLDREELQAVKVYLGVNRRLKYKENGKNLKLGLDFETQRRLLDAAMHYFDMGKVVGSQSGLDGKRLYQTVYLMMQAGLHRKVIADPNGQQITFVGSGLRWFRPKKTGTEALTTFPLPVEARAWAGDYIAWLKAKGGIQWYTLNRICWILGERIDMTVKLSPLTLRHTCGVNLVRRGVALTQICTLMNCTMRVAQRYAKESVESIGNQMEKDGILLGPGNG